MVLSRELALKNDFKLIIREAEESDAQEIIAYVKKVAGESDNLTFGAGEFNIALEDEKKLIAAFKHSPNSLLLLGIIEDRIVALLSFSAGKKVRISHVGEFGITVSKEFWSLGIGKGLIDFMINWAKDSKIIRKINLRVRNDNYKAIELYKKMGFIQEGSLARDMFINGQFVNTLIMGLCID